MELIPQTRVSATTAADRRTAINAELRDLKLAQLTERRAASGRNTT